MCLISPLFPIRNFLDLAFYYEYQFLLLWTPKPENNAAPKIILFAWGWENCLFFFSNLAFGELFLCGTVAPVMINNKSMNHAMSENELNRFADLDACPFVFLVFLYQRVRMTRGFTQMKSLFS